jgi:chromosome segregation ATPase
MGGEANPAAEGGSVADLQDQLRAARAEIEKLREELGRTAGVAAELAETQAVNAVMETTMQAAQAYQEKLLGQLNALKGQKQAEEDQSAAQMLSLRQQLVTAGADVKRLQGELGNTKGTLQVAQSQNSELLGQLEASRGEEGRRAAYVLELEQQLATATAVSEQLKTELGNAKAALQAAQSHDNDIEASKTQVQETDNRYAAQVQEMQQQLATAAADVKRLKGELNSAKTAWQVAQVRADELLRQVNTVKAESQADEEQRTAQVLSLRQQLVSLSSNLKVLKDELTETRASQARESKEAGSPTAMVPVVLQGPRPADQRAALFCVGKGETLEALLKGIILGWTALHLKLSVEVNAEGVFIKPVGDEAQRSLQLDLTGILHVKLSQEEWAAVAEIPRVASNRLQTSANTGPFTGFKH